MNQKIFLEDSLPQKIIVEMIFIRENKTFIFTFLFGQRDSFQQNSDLIAKK